MDAISVNQLSKYYGKARALEEVSFTVPQGRLVGFLGPNGSGKSTTIRILLGMVRATSGTARVLDQDCWKGGPSLRQQVGYVPAELHCFIHLTGADNLSFLADARGIDCQNEIDRLTQVFQLDLSRRVRDYSSGMRQKLGLIQAMMHRPRLLVLDEPTNNLDPLVRQVLYGELVQVVERGQTVLLSSHTLSELESLCEEIVILRDGQVVDHQTMETLRLRAGRKITMVFPDSEKIPEDYPDSLEITACQENRITAVWNGPLEPFLSWISTVPLHDLVIAPPDLEHLFLSYYRCQQSELRP